MRKIIVFCLFLGVFAVSLFSMNAEITAVKGKVEVKKGISWVKPKTGDTLSGGDMVSTGFNSELTVKIDGSMIVVKPLTRLRIQEIAKKNDAVSSEVFINVGSIKANVKPASTKRVQFKVKTPVATASVRGTSGVISADGGLLGTSGVWAYGNNIGDEVFVSAGKAIEIDDTGSVVATQTIMAKDRQENVIASLAAEKKIVLTAVPVAEDSVLDFIELGLPTAGIDLDLQWID